MNRTLRYRIAEFRTEKDEQGRWTKSTISGNGFLLEGGPAFGVNVLYPELVSHCALGCITPNNPLDAMRVALTSPLPPDDALLLTTLPGLETYAAMAILEMRQQVLLSARGEIAIYGPDSVMFGVDLDNWTPDEPILRRIRLIEQFVATDRLSHRKKTIDCGTESEISFLEYLEQQINRPDRLSIHVVEILLVWLWTGKLGMFQDTDFS